MANRASGPDGLTVRKLLVRNARGRPLLAVEALDITTGSCVGIRGPSGAGKSTLLLALAGLTPHTRGVCRWQGQPLTGRSAAQAARFRRERLGFAFQDSLLFEELSALGNAALAAGYAKRDDDRQITRRARHWLERLGIDASDKRPVIHYSGGERQRIALARALANDPELLFADEPTSSLDDDTGRLLIDDLLGIARTQATTLLVVSHDGRIHNRMDRIIDLHNGAIVGGATDD